MAAEGYLRRKSPSSRICDLRVGERYVLAQNAVVLACAQGVRCFDAPLAGPIKKPLPITHLRRTESDSSMTAKRLPAPTSHGLVHPNSPGLWCLAPQPVGV